MNAARVASALAERAEEVCRRYLPNGRRSGRYWVAGDIRGARGRSLFVRLDPPGVPGKWTDAASMEHGDLPDLVRIASDAGSVRAALAEARAFLSLPPLPASPTPDSYDRIEAARRLWQRCRSIDGTPAAAHLRARGGHPRRLPPAPSPPAPPRPAPPGPDTYAGLEAAPRLWQRCRSIDGTHAEAYLRARAIHRCRFPALRYHPALLHRDEGGVRRLPALVAAVTADAGEHPGHGALTGVHRTWLDPSHPAKANLARPRK
ncbi:MAG: hypothetical protein OXF79_02115, partial [Chloroflexi bacterium]|nr:hypothetical protein [Chloroflexota bacterium]